MLWSSGLNKIPTASIKSKRNKVIQVLSKKEPQFYVVKIMVFRNELQFRWFEKEVGERLEVLRRLNNVGILEIIQRSILEVQVKETEEERVVYLTRREIIGPTLHKLFERQKLVKEVLQSENIKSLIWSIFALVVGGGGYSSLIITLENIMLEEIGELKYKPAINMVSFIGCNLLKFKKDIEKEEFLEIAVFLDEEALLTGEMDRFEFKAKNFAILIVSLLLKRNLANFVFRNMVLPNAISLEKARELYKDVIRPSLKKVKELKILHQAFEKLNIPGLEPFIHSVLSFEHGLQGTQNWSNIHSLLLGNSSQPSDSNIKKISRLLWEHEQQGLKQILNKKGLGLGEKGDLIYMAYKISTHLQCLLRHNNWGSMMKKLEYNYKTHEMLYRLMKCVSFKEEAVLGQTTLQLLNVSKGAYMKIGRVKDSDGKEIDDIYTHTYKRTILDQYMNFL